MDVFLTISTYCVRLRWIYEKKNAYYDKSMRTTALNRTMFFFFGIASHEYYCILHENFYTFLLDIGTWVPIFQ